MVLFDPQKASEQYLKRLLARYETVTLPIDSASQALPLRTVFQPMVLHRDPLALQHEPPGTATEIIKAKDGAEALLKSDHGRMVVLGGPGMGKTTALKALLSTAITTAQADLSAPVPLFVSLPDLGRAGFSFEAYIRQVIAELEIDPRFASSLAAAVNAGQAFLCLDSLDEVLPALRPDMIAFLNQEASRLRGTWIIGSRFTEYKGGQFTPGQFTEWELQALDHEARLALARQLLPALHDALYEHVEQKLKPTAPSAEAYIEELHQSTQIAAWGENPLLFSLAAVLYAQTGALPASRAVLYAQVTEAMFTLRIHDAEQRAEVRHLLAEIALEFYQTRGRNFSIADALEFLPSLLPGQSTSSLYDTLARLLDAGALEPVAYQVYGFKHQMFQEYLAALALARRCMDTARRQDTWDLLWRKRRLSRWNEILCLLVGILAQEYGAAGLEVVHDWLSALALEYRTSEGDPGTLCLSLAMKSLGELGDHLTDPEVEDLAKQILETWEQTYTALVRLGGWQYSFILRAQTRVFSAFSLRLMAPIILRLQPYGLDTWDFCRLPFSASMIDRPALPIHLLQHLFEDESISLYTCHTIHALQTPAVMERAAAILENADGRWSVEDQATIARLLGELREKTPVSLLVKTWQDTTLAEELRQSAAETLSTAEVPVALDVFVAMLHDPAPLIRWVAIDFLSRRGGQAYLSLLVSALQDADLYVREKALFAVHELKVPLPIALLRTLFYDERGSVSEVARKCLLEMGEQVPLELWLDALQHEYPWVREGALQAIERYRDRVPVEALLDMLALYKKESYWRLSESADCVQALGLLGDRVPLDPLLELLQLDNTYLRSQVLSVLTQRHVALPTHLLLPMLGDDIAGEVAQAIAVLGENAPISSLLERARSGVSQRAHAACQALRLLYQYVPTEPVLGLLQDEEIIKSPYSTYGELIQLLQLQGVEIPLELLLPVLKRPHDGFDVALLAASLSRAGAQAPIEPLLHLIYEETRGLAGRLTWILQLFSVLYVWVSPERLTNALGNTPDDQWLAVSLLGSVGDEESIRLLTTVAQDPARDRTTRCEAMVVLNNLGVNLPLHYLIQAARWPVYQDMGTYLADTVERLGERTPVEQLLPFLGEDDSRVQQVVVEALIRIAGHILPEMLLPLLEDNKASVRYSALRILAARGEHTPLEVLTALLHAPGQMLETRRAVLSALGEMGTPAAVDVLLEALGDERAEIRHSALGALRDDDTKSTKGGLRALKERGKEIPLEPLLRLLNDPDGAVVRAAIGVLGELGSLGVAVPIEPLVSFLDHEDEFIAGDAVEALCKFGERAPVDALLTYMDDTDNEQIRSYIFFQLSALEARAPLEAMLATLSESDTSIKQWYRESALENLAGSMPEEILKRLHDDPRPWTRRIVLKAIQTTRSCEWLPLVLDTLRDADGRYAAHDQGLYDTSMTVRAAAVQTLGALNACAPIEPLLDLLQANEEEYGYNDERMVVLKALRAFGSRVPRSALWPLLGATHAETARLAFQTLQEAHPAAVKELVPALQAMARGEPMQGAFAARMHYRIAETVAAMGRATPAVLEMVGSLLDHPSREVRARAAKTLGAMRRNIPDRAIQRLLDLRKDPESPGVRLVADLALAEILSQEQAIEEEGHEAGDGA